MTIPYWWHLFDVGVRRKLWWRKRQKPSPTPRSCRQHISSPTSVINIDLAKTSCILSSNWSYQDSNTVIWAQARRFLCTTIGHCICFIWIQACYITCIINAFHDEIKDFQKWSEICIADFLYVVLDCPRTGLSVCPRILANHCLHNMNFRSIKTICIY